MNLKICLSNKIAPLAYVLRQEGIPFFISPDLKSMYSYVENGGVALKCGTSGCGDGEIRSSLYTKSHKRGKGVVISINPLLEVQLDDQRSITKEFATSAGVVRENVALFSKSKAREELSKAVASAFYLLGLPFVRIWYYPRNYRSLFNFRFDLDEDIGNEIEKIADIARGYRDCTTMFACCASFENSSHKIKRLIDEDYDIQSHGYYHHTYSSEEQNRSNIQKSIDYFRNMGHEVEGFAAPKGRWNKGLQTVLEKSGFLYSSEFSLGYDDFPFYPASDGAASVVLQIPIHPICWGLYKDAGIFDDEAIKRYIFEVISKKYDNREPVIIYGHPGEGISKNPRLLNDIYEYSCGKGNIWRTNLSNLAKWWKKRDRIIFSDISFESDKGVLKYTVDKDIDFSDAYLSIQRGPAKRAYYGIFKVSQEIDLNDIKYEDIEEGASGPVLYGERIWEKPITKRIKDGIIDMLDWEECTPVNELRRENIMSQLKYVLRKCNFDKVKINV